MNSKHIYVRKFYITAFSSVTKSVELTFLSFELKYVQDLGWEFLNSLASFFWSYQYFSCSFNEYLTINSFENLQLTVLQ
jgi:hypothetical protein